MSSQFFSALLSGSITGPQSLINAGGPLPSIPSSAPAQYHAIPDGNINPSDQTRLLQGGLQDFIYAYGPNPSRLTTQTQMNIPNKIQLIIPKIFIPSAVSDGSAYQDPILEHALSDGDLVFSLKMNREMVGLGSQSYVIYPQGYTDRAVKLINLATANYILWGLQVGASYPQGGGRMWKNFFSHLCKSKLPNTFFSESEQGVAERGGENSISEAMMLEHVWNFIKTYLAPYGVQHGSDMQGGQHEGSKTRVVSTNAVDYVSSFAVEGKILKMNNLWRAHDVNENDDLVLALRYMPPQTTSHIQFVLSSSNRSSRTERAPVSEKGWWYLNPEVLEYKTLHDTPHIHIARSQKMITSFTQNAFGMDMPAWNARACIHGPPLQVTLEPSFVSSDMMWFRDTLGVSSTSTKITKVNDPTKTHADQVGDGSATEGAESSVLGGLKHAYSSSMAASSGVTANKHLAKQDGITTASSSGISSGSLFSMMMANRDDTSSADHEHDKSNPSHGPPLAGKKRSILHETSGNEHASGDKKGPTTSNLKKKKITTPSEHDT